MNAKALAAVLALAAGLAWALTMARAYGVAW